MRKKGQTLINERIKSLREESSHTQQQLAEKLGIKNQTVSCYESGEREPSYEIILKLADYFNVSVDYLLGRTDVKTPNIDMIAIHKQTGLSEESIKTLKENYEDWPDNTFTKTLNVLIDNGYVLRQIAMYLFYKLKKDVPIVLKCDSAPPDGDWGYKPEDLFKLRSVDSDELHDLFDEGRLKKILLFELQTELEKMLSDIKKNKGE